MPDDNLFGDLMRPIDNPEWKEHWKGMPEFKQLDAEPWKQVIVNFESEKDMLDFARLVDQKITYKTPSIWFPKVERVAAIDKIWVDKK